MRHCYPEGSPFNPSSEVHAERSSLREAKEVSKKRGGGHK